MLDELTGRALRLALPKGRMQSEVFALLDEAGLRVRNGERAYRPSVGSSGIDAKILKPQNIIEMLVAGTRDVGFAGADWVAELDGDLVELLDTELDPVRLVVAAPHELLAGPPLRSRTNLAVASEYLRLTSSWLTRSGVQARLVRSYGATEVFPPDDADLIVDNTATGATLTANHLAIIEVLMSSSTRLYANRRALETPGIAERIENFTVLVRSVLEARRRVTMEVNVSSQRLEAVCALLPCMREPTIAMLHGAAGFAVKVAVPRTAVPDLIPMIRAAGGTDIVISSPTQIVP